MLPTESPRQDAHFPSLLCGDKGIHKICGQLCVQYHYLLTGRSLTSMIQNGHQASGALRWHPQKVSASIARGTLLVNADHVVGLKFVRHSAVANAGDHRSHALTLFYKVFRADWVIETLANGEIAEFDAVAGRSRSHKENR